MPNTVKFTGFQFSTCCSVGALEVLNAFREPVNLNPFLPAQELEF
jgi:hypothetical protein